MHGFKKFLLDEGNELMAKYKKQSLNIIFLRERLGPRILSIVSSVKPSRAFHYLSLVSPLWPVLVLGHSPDFLIMVVGFH